MPYAEEIARHSADVTIVGHHYQQDAVIRHCSVTGDSLELARRVAAIDSPHIVFCGVFFMAESAALLARPGQQVHLPAADANCVMAQMAPAALVRAVLSRLAATGRRIVPLAYVNTPLAVKAVVGEFGGAVCTSANAAIMLRWALNAGDGVLFLPDANLGRNTAHSLGLTEQDWHVLDIRRNGLPGGGPVPDRPLLLWPGCCAIHAKIRPEHLTAMRAAHPDCRIAVHPECSPACVQAADAAGSTSFLINYVRQAAPGSVVGIGTEANLVHRLRRQYAGHCTVLPVREVICHDMAKTTEERLLACLRSIKAGQARPVIVPERQKAPAKASLERMLDVCARTGA